MNLWPFDDEPELSECLGCHCWTPAADLQWGKDGYRCAACHVPEETEIHRVERELNHARQMERYWSDRGLALGAQLNQMQSDDEGCGTYLACKHAHSTKAGN